MYSVLLNFHNVDSVQVISEGDVSGPAGVTLTLYKGQGQVVQETTSVTGGSFTFEKVLPGSYIVDASHKVWQFKKVCCSRSPMIVLTLKPN